MIVNNRILFIHQEKHVGGGKTYVDGLNDGFRKLGFEVELLEGLRTVELIKRLFSYKGEVVIWSIYDTFPLLSYIFSFLLGKKNILVIYGIWKLEIRALFDQYDNSELVRDQKLRELKYLVKQFIFVFFAFGIVHLSRYSQELFFEIPAFKVFRKKKACIIYGGADRRYFRKVSSDYKRNLRKKIGMGEKDVVLLMVGRIERRKSYHEALKVLKDVKQMLPNTNVFLYLVLSFGSFNDYSYLDFFFTNLKKANVGENVRIISGITNDKIGLFYQCADVYLMLSRELETFGLVSLEALLSGIPVFGYKTCATPEILSKSDDVLFSVGMSRSISKAIVKYIKMDSNQKKKFMTGISENLKEFTWENSAKKVVSILN